MSQWSMRSGEPVGLTVDPGPPYDRALPSLAFSRATLVRLTPESAPKGY